MKPYALVIDDAGCHLSKRFEERSDCTVRAMAIVTGLNYDHIYDVLDEAGRPRHQGFDSDIWLKKRNGQVFGGRFKPIKVKGLTPNLFPVRFPIGRYLVETHDHVYCVIDSVAYDLIRTKEQPLTGAWRWITP